MLGRLGRLGELGLRRRTPAPAEPEDPSNLIANGGFDDSSAWTLGGDAAIAGGKLEIVIGPGTAAQDTLTPITENLFYLLGMTVSDRVEGVATPSLGGTAGTTRGTDGTFSEYLRAGATQQFLLDGEALLRIDNVSLTGPVATALNAELVPDPTFDDDTLWSISGSGLSVTGSQLMATGGVGNRSATCVPEGYPLNAGTYDVTFTLVSRTAGTARIDLCGIIGTGRTVPGTYTQQFVVTEADTVFQTIIVRAITSPNLIVDDLSVKKIA